MKALRLAAALGNNKANLALANMYRRGYGVAENCEVAAMFYERVSNEGFYQFSEFSKEKFFAKLCKIWRIKFRQNSHKTKFYFFL